MNTATNQEISTEDQIKLLRESYRRRDSKDRSNAGGAHTKTIGKSTTTNPEFGDSDIVSDFPPSDILQPTSRAVSGILDKSIPPTTKISTLDINLDEVYSTTLNRDLLRQSVSNVEILIPELKDTHSTLKLRYIGNSINKGRNGKFLLKFVDDTTSHIYYWDGEKKDGKITLYNRSNNDEGKQFYKKYPHPAIVKSIIY